MINLQTVLSVTLVSFFWAPDEPEIRIRDIDRMLYKCSRYEETYFSVLDSEERARICLMLEGGKQDIIKGIKKDPNSNSYWFYKFKEMSQRGMKIPEEGDHLEKAKMASSFLQELESIIGKENFFRNSINRITGQPAVETEQARLEIVHTTLEGPTAEITERPEMDQAGIDACWKLLNQLIEGGQVTAEEKAQIIKLCIETLAQP